MVWNLQCSQKHDQLRNTWKRIVIKETKTMREILGRDTTTSQKTGPDGQRLLLLFTPVEDARSKSSHIKLHTVLIIIQAHYYYYAHFTIKQEKTETISRKWYK